MKIEIILGIVSGICIFLGCVFYLIHNNREEDKKFGILSVIFTALGIGLFIGLTNKPHVPGSEYNNSNPGIEEVIDGGEDDDIIDNEIDP